MKKALLLTLILPIVATLIIVSGWARKYSHRNSLRIGVGDVSLSEPFRLKNLVNPVDIITELVIDNFAPIPFEVQQIAIGVFTDENEELAKIAKPLSDPLTIEPNKANTFPLRFTLTPQRLKNLIQDSGGIFTVLERFTDTGSYGINIQLKGFVIAEGFKIPVNEKQTI